MHNFFSGISVSLLRILLLVSTLVGLSNCSHEDPQERTVASPVPPDLKEQAKEPRKPYEMIDLNQNGIDDRVEHYFGDENERVNRPQPKIENPPPRSSTPVTNVIPPRVHTVEYATDEYNQERAEEMVKKVLEIRKEFASGVAREQDSMIPEWAFAHELTYLLRIQNWTKLPSDNNVDFVNAYAKKDDFVRWAIDNPLTMCNKYKLKLAGQTSRRDNSQAYDLKGQATITDAPVGSVLFFLPEHSNQMIGNIQNGSCTADSQTASIQVKTRGHEDIGQVRLCNAESCTNPYNNRQTQGCSVASYVFTPVKSDACASSL